MAGAFFPQPELEVPEEEMGQHTSHHMMDPAREFAHLVVVHSKLRLRFLKALLDGPANTAQPYEEFEAGAQTRIAAVGQDLFPWAPAGLILGNAYNTEEYI